MADATISTHTVEQLIRDEKLPAGFITTVDDYYRPLARSLAVRADGMDRPLLVGVNGAQGTGKSTLTRFLGLLLEKDYGLPTASFSLDDIYLTKAQRQALGNEVHPMLAVRGVPGTHDIDLGLQVLAQLRGADDSSLTNIPVFDKAVDDRAAQDQWVPFRGRPAVIIVEGWCVGARAEADESLRHPLNELEAVDDADGVWRHYVNEQLKTRYRRFFDELDVLVFIPAPCWEVVYKWRLLQEEKLAARCREQGLDDSGVMSPRQVARFVQYYERVTRHTLEEMGARADYVLTMEEDHRISGLSGVLS